MKRFLGGSMLLSTVLLVSVPLSRAATKANPADYTIKVHVSGAEYVETNALFEILTVTIGDRHYQMQGPTSSSKAYMHGNGLLNPGDYSAKLTTDTHKTAFESEQTFELLLPDGTTRQFSVIAQSE